MVVKQLSFMGLIADLKNVLDQKDRGLGRNVN